MVMMYLLALAPLHRPDSLPSSINYIPTDVRSEIGINKFIDCASQAHGKLDVLINNAGFSAWRPLSGIDLDFLNKFFQLIYIALF